MSDKKTQLKDFRKAVVAGKKSLQISKTDFSAPVDALSAAAVTTGQSAKSLVSKFVSLQKLLVAHAAETKPEKKAAKKEKAAAYIAKAVEAFEKKVADIDAKLAKMAEAALAKKAREVASKAKKAEKAKKAASKAKKAAKAPKSPKAPKASKKSKKDVQEELSQYLFGF